ncbi:MAG: adenylate/guanylate cyclase domain-containing protein [Nocardioides sp.]
MPWIVLAVLVVVLVSGGVLHLRQRADLLAARSRVLELEAAVHRLETIAADALGERPESRTARVARGAARAAVLATGRLREGGVGGLVSASFDDLARFVTEDRVEIERIATPDGTITILFSDIVDSTATNERLGDKDWLKVLRAHDDVIRREVGSRRGHIVKSQGDGHMVVFPDPLAGVRAALAIQECLPASRRLRLADIHVRIGLHTGRVLSHEGDYFGRNVAMAARVAAHASADEVLISDAVREAVVHAPALATDLVATTELKGLAGEHDLWRVTTVIPD